LTVACFALSFAAEPEAELEGAASKPLFFLPNDREHHDREHDDERGHYGHREELRARHEDDDHETDHHEYSYGAKHVR
jgi:hypothetical protein